MPANQLKVNYIHKDKHSILIGNTIQYGTDPVDIYINEHTIPSQIIIRMGNQPWNYRSITVAELMKVKHPREMMYRAYIAYITYDMKKNQCAG